MIPRSNKWSPPPTSKDLVCAQIRFGLEPGVRVDRMSGLMLVSEQRAAEAWKESPRVTRVERFALTCHQGFLMKC